MARSAGFATSRIPPRSYRPGAAEQSARAIVAVHGLFLTTRVNELLFAGTFGWAQMVAHVTTVAFQGIEAVPVDVQVHLAPGKQYFGIVGLPDKAVNESRDRVSAALHA